MASDTDTTPEPQEDQEQQKLTLEVSVDKPSTCQRHVTVKVARADIDRYMGDAYDELMPKAEVPGFRAGRAPRKLIESRFKEQVTERVKGNLLMDSMSQVSDECDFSAISEPDFDFEAVTLPDEGPLTFEFDIEVRPEFEMPQWEGLELQKSTYEYSTEEVENRTETLISKQYGSIVDADEVEAGDYVNLEMSFSADGQVTAEESHTLEVLPTVSFADAELKDFDKLMVGAKVGDTLEAKVTISDGVADEAIRGKEIDGSLKVTSIKRRHVPKLTEQFLQEIGGFDNIGELHDLVKSELTRQFEYHQQQAVRRQITATLTKDAEWELPPDLLKRQARRELERAVMERRAAGFGEDDIQRFANQLQQSALASTKQALQEHFILERIAEDNDLDAEAEDFDAEIALIAAQTNESPRRVRARMEKRGQMDVVRNQIIERKAIDMIIEKAKVTEVPFEPEDGEEETNVSPCPMAVSGASDEEIPEAKSAGGEAQGLRLPTDHT